MGNRNVDHYHSSSDTIATMSAFTKLELHQSVIISIIRLAANETQRGKPVDQIIREVASLVDPVNNLGLDSKPFSTAPMWFPGFGGPGTTAPKFSFGQFANPPVIGTLGVFTGSPCPKPVSNVCPDAPKKTTVAKRVILDDHDDTTGEPQSKVRRQLFRGEPVGSPVDEPKTDKNPRVPEFKKYRCGYIYSKGNRSGQVCFNSHGDNFCNRMSKNVVKTMSGILRPVCSMHFQMYNRTLDGKQSDARDDCFHPETLIAGVNCDHENDGWKLRQPGMSVGK